MKLALDGDAARLGGVVLIFVAACALYWNGVGENDSFRYIDGALDWIESGPRIGDTHWTLRTLLIAPMAASLAILGPTELAAMVPNFIYAGLLVLATFYMARRYWGAATATWVALAIAVSAFLVGMQIEVSATGAELFFAAIACWFFIDGLRGRRAHFAVAGVLAGAAWLCRETNAFLPLTFFVVLVLQRPLPLRALVETLAPFGAVIAAEMLFYAVAVGDPFYRYLTDLGHRGEGGVYSDLKSNGPVFIEWLVRPFFYLFSDPAATPAFLLAAFALFHREVRSTLLRGDAALVGRTFAFAAVFSFVLSSFALNVKWPSYYSIFGYAAAIAIGVGIATLARTRGLPWGVAAFAAWALVNIAADDFRAYGEIEEARRLVDFIAQTNNTVTSDHVTAGRAQVFLRMRGLDASLARSSLSAAPTCGHVFLANPVERALAIRAEPHWRPLRVETARSRRFTHAIIARTGLGALSPRLAEIIAPPKPIAFYDAGPC